VDDPADDIPPFPPGPTRPAGFDPADGPSAWGGAYSRGTVGMDGSSSGGNSGGTVPF